MSSNKVKSLIAQAMTGKQEYRELTVNAFTIDPRVQRPMEVGRLSKIGGPDGSTFNINAIGTFTASARDGNPDGKGWLASDAPGLILLDGQHRAEKMRRMGFTSHPVHTCVWSGLSLPEEAEMFELLNNTKQATALDLYHVRLIKGDPDALELARITSTLGWSVPTSGTNIRGGDGTIAAIQALERIHDMTPPEWASSLAELVLETVTRAWGHNRTAVNGAIMRGCAAVWLAHSSVLNVEELAKKIQAAGPPEVMLGQAQGARMRYRNLMLGCQEAIIRAWNVGRSKRLLPSP
jgi:hypothetical protein